MSIGTITTAITATMVTFAVIQMLKSNSHSYCDIRFFKHSYFFATIVFFVKSANNDRAVGTKKRMPTSAFLKIKLFINISLSFCSRAVNVEDDKDPQA